MDEAVKLALAKWPTVPACTGWLRLTRRGEWKVPDGVIRHAGLRAFIGRNYDSTPDGRWFFQNGPQRVYVDLDYTPIVLHLRAPEALQTHHSHPIANVNAAWLDEEGNLLLLTEQGIALLDDRDLAAMIERLEGDLDGAGPLLLHWAQQPIPVQRILRSEVAQRFAFIPQPSL